ncbi:MAG: hypothetical protein A2286_06090 [Gammaproteobacteria bacterium RIFOXYA12_FULL_61_12]|nr:MAG: hypothetical protein A2286_06090 [Gammaproteobacteria bacterium RIFOXYA12_FULL_61_12]
MQDGFRFRCYPDKAHQKKLMPWIGHQRFIYNAKISEDRYFQRFKNRFREEIEEEVPIDQQYSHFITELTPWLRDVPSQVLRNGVVRWMQAYRRFFKKLGGRPTFQKANRKQSVWLTSELFSICRRNDRWFIRIGTKKFKIGEFEFVPHREFSKLPASVVLSVEGGHWYLGFSNEDDQYEPTRDEIGEYLETFTCEDLLERTIGIDRNTPAGKQVAVSSGQAFAYGETQKERMEKKERHNKRYQKRLSLQTKGSNGWRKTRKRIANNNRYTRNIRRDVMHKASRELVDNPRVYVLAFEDLRIQNMTKSPDPKQGPETGKWLENGAAAKAGLNKAILHSGWGLLYTFTRYKAQRAGKLVVQVPAPGSSQECRLCGFTHPDNRKSQSDFVCQRCEHTENADFNASGVIKTRGVKVVLSGQWREKPPQKTLRLKKRQVGPEGSEPGQSTVRSPVETRGKPRGRKRLNAPVEETGNPHYNASGV